MQDKKEYSGLYQMFMKMAFKTNDAKIHGISPKFMIDLLKFESENGNESDVYKEQLIIVKRNISMALDKLLTMDYSPASINRINSYKNSLDKAELLEVIEIMKSCLFLNDKDFKE